MWKTILKSVVAGFTIGIGGAIYLSCDNRYVGAVLFSTGLYAIIALGLNLFTGKVGYAIRDKNMAKHLPIMWIGNLVGAYTSGMMILFSRIAPNLVEKATALCEMKLNDHPVSIFILSCFCGVLMFIAVEGYKRTQNPLIVMMSITVFILSGFEHCIANMVYFTIAGQWSWLTIGYVGIMTLGNAVGSLVLSAICKEYSE